MQAIAPERARGTGRDRPALTILPSFDKAAVDRLAGPCELQGARRHAVVADERLERLCLDELARVLLRDRTHWWGGLGRLRSEGEGEGIEGIEGVRREGAKGGADWRAEKGAGIVFHMDADIDNCWYWLWQAQDQRGV